MESMSSVRVYEFQQIARINQRDMRAQENTMFLAHWAASLHSVNLISPRLSVKK
jgi:hypothetical protein